MARNVRKMKDGGKWRVKKRAKRSWRRRRRKDALGLREDGREREREGRGGGEEGGGKEEGVRGGGRGLVGL